MTVAALHDFASPYRSVPCAPKVELRAPVSEAGGATWEVWVAPATPRRDHSFESPASPAPEVGVSQPGVVRGAPGTFRALVVGNNAYTAWRPLVKCVKDACDVAAALGGEAGDYSVSLLSNGTRAAMDEALAQFAGTLEDGCTAVVYFSGHGLSSMGKNFLVPVDGKAPLSEGVVLLACLSCCLLFVPFFP